MSDGGRRPDLDALMGEIELEAARRRADPRFPIDADVRLGRNLDAQAPHAVDLRRLLTALVATAPAPDPDPPRRRPRRTTPPGPDTATSVLATAQVLAAVVDRLEALEERLEPRPAPPTSGTQLDPGEWAAALHGWTEDLARHPEDLAGRVCWLGPDAEAAVGALRAAGVDAYGVDPSGDEYRSGVDVRTGDAVSHLRAVATDSLATVIVAGPLREPVAGRLDALVHELGRTTPRAVVVSPTPAWWREHCGPVAADLAASRPLSAETWVQAFAVAGWQVAMAADDAGTTFRVCALRPRS